MEKDYEKFAIGPNTTAQDAQQIDDCTREIKR